MPRFHLGPKELHGDTKDEVIDKFKDHLRCVHSFDSRKVPGVVESLCEILETETFLETAAEDTPTPPMPASALTPKQPAMPPPSVENEPAENASSSSKRRKVAPPDESPAPEPDKATVEIGRQEMAAQVHATEAIETSLVNAKKLARATRLFALTLDDGNNDEQPLGGPTPVSPATYVATASLKKT